MVSGKKKSLIKIVTHTILFGTLFFLAFGMVTALVPNNFFVRMASSTYLDYIFLILTSFLLGAYFSLRRYQKKYLGIKGAVSAYSGGTAGFLGFGCSVCNKLFILLLGITGTLVYVEPYRPFIGSLGVVLMGHAVYSKARHLLLG